MQSPMPLSISVLIRSMDRTTLDRALDSVAAQTRQPDEVLVVSARGPGHRPLPERIGSAPLRLIESDRPLARAAAGNVLLRAARGDWLNFLDDDDAFLPGHLHTLATVAATAGAAVAVVHAVAEVIDARGAAGQRLGAPFDRLAQLDCGFIAFGAALFRRRLLDRGLALDEGFSVLEDMDFWIQCAALGDMAFVDQVSYRYFAADGQSGIGLGHQRHDAALAAALERLKRKWLDPRATTGREQRLRAAQHALRNGQDGAALALLRPLVDEYPEDVNVLNIAGVAELRCGDLDVAERLFRAALQRVPGHAQLSSNLALVQARRAGAPAGEER